MPCHTNRSSRRICARVIACGCRKRLGEFEEGGLDVSIRMDKREDEQQALQVLARQRQQQPRRAQGGREGDLRARRKPAARRLVQAQQVQHERPVLSRSGHGKGQKLGRQLRTGNRSVTEPERQELRSPRAVLPGRGSARRTRSGRASCPRFPAGGTWAAFSL